MTAAAKLITTDNATRRAYQLVPWVVSALVPPAVPGTYMLFTAGIPVYVGRSDTDLRRRLVEHARVRRGAHFDFEVHRLTRAAFLTECATFHAFDTLDNRIHPAVSARSNERCPFCRAAATATIAQRLKPDRPSLQEVVISRPITH